MSTASLWTQGGTWRGIPYDLGDWRWPDSTTGAYNSQPWDHPPLPGIGLLPRTTTSTKTNELLVNIELLMVPTSPIGSEMEVEFVEK